MRGPTLFPTGCGQGEVVIGHRAGSRGGGATGHIVFSLRFEMARRGVDSSARGSRFQRLERIRTQSY